MGNESRNESKQQAASSKQQAASSKQGGCIDCITSLE
jgi:hypothetical protein